jgi:hypothetical protein
MAELLWGTVILLAGAVLGCGALIARLLTRYDAAPGSGAVSAEEDPGRYQVMARLVSEEDLEFLRTLPGFRGRAAPAFRRERRRIFRLYLQEIAADFRRLHSAARALASQAPEEHADLVGVLFRQQVLFWRALCLIEIRLMLYAAGVPKIDTAALLGCIEELRSAVARAAPAGLPA